MSLLSSSSLFLTSVLCDALDGALELEMLLPLSGALPKLSVVWNCPVSFATAYDVQLSHGCSLS